MKSRRFSVVFVAAFALIFGSGQSLADPTSEAKSALKSCIDTEIDSPKPGAVTTDTVIAHCQSEYQRFMNALPASSILPRSRQSIYADLIREYVTQRLADPSAS